MIDKKKVPKRRFKEFKDSGAWEQRKLGEVGKFNKGKGYSKKDILEEGIPVILYGNLYTDYKTIIKEVNTFAKDKGNSVYSLGNEVIIPSSGESSEDIARASAVVKKGIILGGDLNIIQPNENIDSIFLALLISSGEVKRELIKKAQGKSVVHLYNTDLKELNLIYPSIEEQKRIGNFFLKLDSLITLHQRKLEKLKNLKKSYLSEMFPQKGEKYPKRRFKGFTDPWEQRKLSDIVSLFGGNAFSSQNSVDNGAKWLKIANVGTGQLKWNEGSFLPISYLDDYSAYRLKVGDYVMALTRPIIRNELKIAEITEEDILLNQRVAKLIFSCDIKFGYQMLRKSSTVDKIENELAGTDPPNLSTNTLNNIDIRVPSLTEQNKIGEYFNRVDSLITLHQRKLEKLENIKKAYLNEMFV